MEGKIGISHGAVRQLLCDAVALLLDASGGTPVGAEPGCFRIPKFRGFNIKGKMGENCDINRLWNSRTDVVNELMQ